MVKIEKIGQSATKILYSYYVLHNNISQIGQFDMQNNLIAIYDSMSAAARAIDGSVSAISQVCVGKAKTHKGFIWKKQYKAQRLSERSRLLPKWESLNR